jgi:hypothetical protein
LEWFLLCPPVISDALAEPPVGIEIERAPL